MATLIVGSGVAGLTAATVLHAADQPFTVLEANDRIGGRVHSLLQEGQHLGDLGPSWVWPPYQPILTRWLETLDMATFAQYEDGMGCIERSAAETVQFARLPGQPGQARPIGGPQALVHALRHRLPESAVITNAQVTAISADREQLAIATANGQRYVANSIILAAPLRVIARDITFSPDLPATLMATLASSSTWMASHAKALITYERPFWREQGRSGRLASALGPLVELHDHCDPNGGSAALVGFIGVDAASRAKLRRQAGPAALRDAVLAQLVRCFGDEAAHPAILHIEDWACAPLIATDADITMPGGHPAVLSAELRRSHMDGRLHFAVAETAAVSPGLLEGALCAGENAATKVLARD